jgi:thioredoxin-related protein
LNIYKRCFIDFTVNFQIFMEMKRLFFYIILFFNPLLLLAQSSIDTIPIKWLTFEETKQQFEKVQKPVFIFVYKNKSDSCKLMLDSVLRKNEVSNYINVLFYPIKFDAETKDPIKFFDDKVYQNKTGIHDLVARIASENATYPFIVCFNRESNGRPFFYYKNRDKLFPILIYYAEDMYKSVEYEEFEKYYFKTYPPGQKQIITRVNVKWRTLSEAESECKLSPRKLFITVNNRYRISSSMMSLTTLNNPQIASYLNEKFYPVNLDAQTNDTITFLGNKYINEKQKHGFHQLPIVMLEGKMQFPVILILDENFKLLDRVQLYLTPELIEPILNYFGENEYKSKSWTEYKAGFKSSFK